MRITATVTTVGLLAAAAASSGIAQRSPVQQGSLRIAGSAALTHNGNRDNGTGITTVSIAPNVGYFVVSGLAIDLAAGYAHTSADGGTGHSVSAGPGLTWFPWTRPSRAYPFLSGGVFFGRHVSDPDLPGALSSKTTDFGWSASAGVLLMASEHVGLTGELFYERNRDKLRLGTLSSVTHSENYGLRWGVAAFVF